MLHGIVAVREIAEWSVHHPQLLFKVLLFVLAQVDDLAMPMSLLLLFLEVLFFLLLLLWGFGRCVLLNGLLDDGRELARCKCFAIILYLFLAFIGGGLDRTSGTISDFARLSSSTSFALLLEYPCEYIAAFPLGRHRHLHLARVRWI